MLYEILPSMTARARSPHHVGAAQQSDNLMWLPQTLKTKLNEAELNYLSRHCETLVRQTREQVAHELHHNTLQTLTALSYNLTTLQLGSNDVFKQDLQNLHHEVKTAIAQLRSDIHGLCSIEQAAHSINKRLEQYITRLEQKFSVPTIHQTFDPTAEALPQALRRCALSVLKEGLLNAIKHARANHVWLKVFFQKHKLVISVVDDGKGFAVATLRLAKRKLYGLTGLAEQVTPLNGRVFVRSRPGRGTLLTSLIPLEERSS
jgi:signal transduction histidine kinase